MPRSLPPLNWFRAFECAARHLSFTAAADEMGVTQSAVSQHVRALEMRLGAPLFVRKPRGLALTDAGRRLLPDVAGAVSTLAGAAAAFEKDDAGDLLTVATSVSFAQWFLVPGMARFLQAAPRARIRLISTIWPDDFLASTADVEIRFGAAELVGEGAVALCSDRLLAVASPRLLPSPLSWTALCELPLIQAVGTSDSWASWSDELGLPPPSRLSQLVDSYGLAVDLARCGAGVALSSVLLAAPGLASGALVPAFVQSTPATDGYFLAIRRRGDGELVDRFRDWLLAEVAASTRAARDAHPALC